MDFFLRSRSQPGPRRRCRAAGPSEPDVDLDQWLELASSGMSPADSNQSGAFVEEAAELKNRLSRVLTSDEQIMLAPASAGPIDDTVWASMSAGQRAKFTRMQLRKLDPRLLSRAITTFNMRRSIRPGN